MGGGNKLGNSLEEAWVAFVHQGLSDRIRDVGEGQGGQV